MALVQDDEMMGNDFEGIPEDMEGGAASHVVRRYFERPEVVHELALLGAEMKLLGFDGDDELMGNWFQELGNKLKSVVQGMDFSRSSSGEINVHIPGVSPEAPASPGLPPPASPGSSLKVGLKMDKKTMLIGAAALAAVFFLMRKK